MEILDYEKYKIFVHIPDIAIPAEGFKTLYILDGNAFTLLFVEAMTLQMRNTKKTGVDPMIIVGIGYQGDRAFHVENRVKDYTPKRLSDKPDKNHPKVDKGGEFIEFEQVLLHIQSDLLTKFPINKDEQSIFGHSLGGLCVLHLLKNNRMNLSKYVSCSPSLWWDNERYFEEISTLGQNREEIISVFVGHEEGDMVKLAERFISHVEDIFKVRPTLYVASEENHMSVVMTVMSRVLRIACRRGE